MHNLKSVILGVITATTIMVIGVYTGFLTFINKFPFLMETVSSLWSSLGTSAIFFLLDAIFFIFVLLAQKKALEKKDVLNISYYGSMVALSISIFFGIGVIYTAIGMQNALMGSLGGLNEQSAASVGAWEILSKLINGGIITALMTTIVGGVGGYVMRIIKQLYITKALDAFLYESEKKEKELLYEKLDTISSKLGK